MAIKNFTVTRHVVFNIHQIYIDGTFVYRSKTYAFQATTGYSDGLCPITVWKNSQLDISNVESGPEMTAASQKLCRPELIVEATKYVVDWHWNQKAEFDRLLKFTMDENKAKHEQFIKDLKAIVNHCETELAAGFANNTLNPYPIWNGLRHQMWQIDRDNKLGIIS